MTKKLRDYRKNFIFFSKISVLGDGFYGASRLASAARDTFVGVDFILVVAFGDGFVGAGICTTAALNALVADFVRHWNCTSLSW